MNSREGPVCITAGCNTRVKRANARCAEHARARKSALQRKRRQQSDPYPAGPLPAQVAGAIAEELHTISRLMKDFVIAYEDARQARDPKGMAQSAWDFRLQADYLVARMLKQIEPWEELNRDISR